MLRIGVVAYSEKIARSHVLKTLHELEGGGTCYGRYMFKANDGTEYRILNNHNMLGLFLDQLFIIDDERWLVYDRQCETIEIAKQTLRKSSVPEDYQIIEICLDAKGE